MTGALYFSDTTHPELHHLGFKRIQPHPELRPYISSYWLIDANLSLSRQENFYPDGGSGFLFNLGNAINNHGQAIVESVFQSVELTKSVVTFAGPTQALGVRFLPGGAQAFLNDPLGILKEPLIQLESLGKELGDLARQLREIQSWNQRIQHLDTTLRSIRSALPHQKLIQHCCLALRPTWNQPTVDMLAGQLGISDRKLQRVFKAQVGLSPRALRRLHRIALARRQLKQWTIPSFAQLAQDAGYYDQAHYIRDFKRVVGMTPGAYRRRAEARVLYPDMRTTIL